MFYIHVVDGVDATVAYQIGTTRGQNTMRVLAKLYLPFTLGNIVI